MMNNGGAPERTTCLVVGGGPAGMVLGLLMARAGVPVTVLEKHSDFLRDFRGDTVHASTLTLLDELGLGERFAAVPHRLLEQMAGQLDAGTIRIADMRRLPGKHQHIALVPQWDFLDMLADAAEEEPTFTLLRDAEVVGLLHDAEVATTSVVPPSVVTGAGAAGSGGPGSEVAGSEVAGSGVRGPVVPAPIASAVAGLSTAGTSAVEALTAGVTRTGASPECVPAASTRVTGVRYVDRTTGEEHTLHADLTVACDGRASAVRRAAGLVPRGFGVPMDVWWFRLPRHESDPSGGVGRFSTGQFCVMIDRGDYWQCAYLIRKGSDTVLRAAGIEELQRRFAALLPWMEDRVGHLASWDDVKLLDVRLDRLRRWYADGLLLIGDAAHAMSPVGGVGINLAVADAVATARILAPRLRAGGTVPTSLLRRVQWRRWWPTALIQGVQRIAHAGILGPTVAAAPTTIADVPPLGMADRERLAELTPAPLKELPLPMRLLQRFPRLQGIPALLVAIGPLPEHAPAWARRTETPAHARS